MRNRKYIVIGLVIIIALSMGCVESDISSAVNTLPEVQQYLKEHPDAKITAIYLSKEEVEKMSQDINNQCGKIIAPVDMYKVTITDKGLKIISWFDSKNKNLICSSTENTDKDSNIVQTTSTNIPTERPTVIQTTSQQTDNVSVPTPANKILIEHYAKSVDKLTKYVLSNGPEYQYPNPGMTFLVINLKVTNYGYSSVKINSYQWNLKISTKNNPNSYVEADKLYYGEKDGIECKETILEDGGWTLCKIPFEVPKNYDEYKIFWSDYSNKNIEWKYTPEAQTTKEHKIEPTVTQTTEPTVTQTTIQTSCDPSYPDFCIPPPPPDLDCKDIPHKNFKVLQPDPHGFDRDKDGIGCES